MVGPRTQQPQSLADIKHGYPPLPRHFRPCRLATVNPGHNPGVARNLPPILPGLAPEQAEHQKLIRESGKFWGNVFRYETNCAALAAASATILATTPAWASSAAHSRQLGSCSARGDFAICDAGGSVNHPLSLVVHVTSAPDQHISGAWDVVCGKGNGAGGKSGSFSGRTPFKRTLKMPYARPDS
jgi:hypothetical protein